MGAENRDEVLERLRFQHTDEIRSQSGYQDEHGNTKASWDITDF